MTALLVTLHIIVCIALIMIVLLQTGKGADMGAAFGGGGSQTLFGSTGASTFLSTATTWAAIIFMFTCLTLAYVSSHKTGSSIMKNAEVPAATKTEAAPSAEKTDAKPSAPVQTSADTKAEGEKAPADAAPADKKEAAPAATAPVKEADKTEQGKSQQ